jgi:hypothetical protein
MRITILLGIIIITNKTLAQQDSSLMRSNAPKIFLDCNSCDQQYFRQNLPFLNFVRDRRLSEIYVLVSQVNTGSGGVEYSMFLNGSGRFDGIIDTLKYAAPANASNGEVRECICKELKKGVLPCLMKTPLFEKLNYTIEVHDSTLDVNKVKDKWNFWTFSLNANGGGNGNAYSSSVYVNSFVSANRTTEKMKTETGIFGFGNFQRYLIEDSVVRGKQTNLGSYHFYAKSVGKHWAVGEFGTYFRSSVQNLNHSVTWFGGIEYNVFPYSEASRRQLRFLYRAGMRYQDYLTTTIYNTTYAWYGVQSLVLNYRQVEKWGTFNFAAGGFHYFNHPENYNLSFNPSINWNPARGLSIGLFGNYSLVNDQFFLSAGEVSANDILLQQKALATTYSFFGGFNISYTFGSIYNSVVNVRFNINDNFW